MNRRNLHINKEDPSAIFNKDKHVCRSIVIIWRLKKSKDIKKRRVLKKSFARMHHMITIILKDLLWQKLHMTSITQLYSSGFGKLTFYINWGEDNMVCSQLLSTWPLHANGWKTHNNILVFFSFWKKNQRLSWSPYLVLLS